MVGRRSVGTGAGVPGRPAQSRPVLAAAVGMALVGIALVGMAWMVMMVAAPAAMAGPPAPLVHPLEQPGGEIVEARAYGDAFANGLETLDGGYTVLQNADGVWVYAQQTPGGRLVPGDTPAHLAPPSDLDPHLRAATKPPDDLVASTTVLGEDDLGNTSAGNNIGTQRSVVILVSFTNVAPQTQPADWSQRFFGATNSVADYYDEVSFGKLAIVPAAESGGVANDGIIGWIPLNRTHPGNADDEQKRVLASQAIAAATPWINYAAFDTSGDGAIQPEELHITVILAGGEASLDPTGSCGPVMWGHRWTVGADGTQSDGVSVGGFLDGGGYTMFGERHCVDNVNISFNRMATLGIMVHEIGHDLGMPDLYDTDSGQDPNRPKTSGVGQWSVMGGGSWLGTPAGSQPPHPDAYMKLYQGWITPQLITGTQNGVGIATAAQNPAAVQLLANPGGVDWRFGEQSGGGEFFLVENRQPVGYDSSLPGCGLLVWHIDESAPFGGSANSDERGVRLVELMQADGFNDLESVGGASDSGDPFPGSSGNTSFSNATNPNNRLNTGSFSGAAMQVQSAGCAPTMTADFSSDGGAGGGGGGGPVSDDLADSIGLTVPLSVEVSTVGATVEGGETVVPANCLNGGNIGATVWYRIQLDTTAELRVDTLGSDYDTVLAVYQSGGGGLSLVQCNDDVAPQVGLLTSSLTFVANGGTTYFVQAGGWGDVYPNAATGNLVLNAAWRPSNDDIAGAQPMAVGERWFGDTSGAGMQDDEQRSPVFCQLGGAEVGRSVWYRYEATANRTLTVDSGGTSYDSILAAYRVDQNNQLEALACNDDIVFAEALTSSISFNVVAGQTYYFQLAGWTLPGGLPFAGSYQLQLFAPPTHDNFGAARPIQPGQTIQTNSPGATLQSDEALPSCTTRAGASVWFDFTAPGAGQAALSTLGSDYDTVMAAYRFDAANNLITELGCNDDSGTEGDLTSRVDFDVVSGSRYVIQVLGYNGQSGDLALTLSDIAAPIAPPGPPRAVSAVAANGRATVRWDPPADDGGSPITAYVVAASPGTGACSTDGTGRSCVITGLTNGITYTLEVTAANAAGIGPSAGTSATPQGPPPAQPVGLHSVTDALTADGRVMAMVRDENKAVWFRIQTSPGATSWASWQALGGCAEQATVGQGADGRMTAVVIGCGSRSVFVRTQNTPGSTGWSGWRSLGGCVEQIDLHPNANGRLTVAGIGCGGRSLFVRTQTTNAGTAWSGWQSLGGCVEALDLESQADGRLVAAVTGCGSRSLFTKTQIQTNGSSWSGWAGHGGCLESLDVAPGGSGRLTMAAIGCGGRAVFVKTQQAANSSGWAPWQNLGGCARQLSLGSGINGKLTVAAIGCGGNTAFVRSQTTGGATTWAGWKSQGGCVQHVTLTRRANNKLTLAVLGCGSRALFTRTQAQAGTDTYTPWLNLGGRLAL